MDLKSLEGILEGVGKLRAASIIAWAVNAAAMIGLHITSGVQSAGIIGATVVLAGVNVADGYIRGSHAKALPELIAQGAESVAQVQDPRVDDIAGSVETLASRIAGLEQRPSAPTLPEIIAGLTGRVAAPSAAQSAPTSPEASPAPAPAAPGDPLAPVPSA